MAVAEHLSRSEVDSNRFGVNVHRGVLPEIHGLELLRYLVAHEVDVAILRVPAEEAAQLARLDDVGLPYLVADTLMYYAVPLDKYEPRALRNSNLEFVECDEGLLGELDRLVGEIFPSYKNHYAANPLLAADMLEGYKEWARSFGDGSSPERRAWLVRREGEYIAFATVAFSENCSEGILYGVAPSASGGGVYGDLIRFTQRVSMEWGASTMEVSTQAHNFAVQKVWGREGFAPVRAYVTAHVNALFGLSEHPQDVIDIPTAARSVEDSCSTSPIICAICEHFERPASANRGALFHLSQRFLTPVKSEQPYKVVITYPNPEAAPKPHRAVIRVFEGHNTLCGVGYAELRTLSGNSH